jgi:hypothetical protein
MRRHPRLVGFFWRWHRRIGLTAAILALVLAVTGIALNHSPDLSLDQRFVKGSWVYGLYGDDTQQLPAYRAGEHWLYRSAAGQVYLDSAELAPCQGELTGALELAGLFYIACTDELLLATSAGELVEAITASTGLPAPLSGIGVSSGQPLIQTGGRWLVADLDQLVFNQSAPQGAIIEQLAPGHLPESLRQAMPHRDNWLTWERLLLDIHSGRLAGRAGVLLADFTGLMLCLLGFSGVAMWWLHRRGGRTGS